MSAIAFDTLKFARKLKEAGVPEPQAEAQAEILAEAFLHNLDEMVTRDYLDARIAEFQTRIETRLTSSFNERFAAVDNHLNEIDKRFVEINGKFRMLYWMLALIAASTVPAALTQLFG